MNQLEYNSFVYKWTDNVTGMFYIGVRKGTVDDGYITSSDYFNPEYYKRPSDFTREILGYYQDYSLAREEEIRLLTEVDAAKNILYYNMSNGVKKGFHTEGKKASDETRIKMSESGKRKIFTEKHKENLSKSKKGQTHSIETKEKIRKTKTGQTHTEESKEKCRISSTGRFHTEESRAKMCVVQKGRIVSEEAKINMSIAKKGKKLSEETRKNMSMAQFKRWNDIKNKDITEKEHIS